MCMQAIPRSAQNVWSDREQAIFEEAWKGAKDEEASIKDIFFSIISHPSMQQNFPGLNSLAGYFIPIRSDESRDPKVPHQLVDSLAKHETVANKALAKEIDQVCAEIERDPPDNPYTFYGWDFACWDTSRFLRNCLGFVQRNEGLIRGNPVILDALTESLPDNLDSEDLYQALSFRLESLINHFDTDYFRYYLKEAKKYEILLSTTEKVVLLAAQTFVRAEDNAFRNSPLALAGRFNSADSRKHLPSLQQAIQAQHRLESTDDPQKRTQIASEIVDQRLFDFSSLTTRLDIAHLLSKSGPFPDLFKKQTLELSEAVIRCPKDRNPDYYT